MHLLKPFTSIRHTGTNIGPPLYYIPNLYNLLRITELPYP